MYKTEVMNIGKDANAFKAEKMAILFGDNAPQELVDYCFVINKNQVISDVTEEHSLFIDNVEYAITKVGSAVTKNLNDLGHITLKFDGSQVAEQSGTLYLEDKEYDIKEGSVLEIK